jgi:phenylacetate-CoA ligase
MRTDIQTKLGIRAHDIYGLCEIIGPGVACECERQDGLHIWEDHFYPEILNPKTLEPVPDGTEGELVFSSLTKTGMPLLRYRTRDLCKLYAETCSCGRTHRRMGKITGRTDDMIIIRGVNVFPSQIESVLIAICNDTGEITPNYQIIIEKEGSLEKLSVRVELSDKMFSDLVRSNEPLRRKIETLMYEALGINVPVTLVDPKSLPRSEGKAKRVIDKRKN